MKRPESGTPATPPLPIVRAVGKILGLLGRVKAAVTPPPLRLLEIGSMAYFGSHALLATARLGLADTLVGGPKTAEEMARAIDAQPDLVARLMRAMVSLGVFERTPDGKYALNGPARGLLSEGEGSQRSLLLMAGARWSHLLWMQLADVVRTGRPAHEAVLQKPLFDYLAEHPEEDAEFHRAMLDYSAQTAAACMGVLPFEGARTLVDVGGGLGQFLSMALQRHPEISRGILVDQPAVAEAARQRLASTPHADRIEVVGGDFFREVPGGGDLYVLMNILHDWSDEQAIQILRNCRAAARAGARVCAVEMVISEKPFGEFPPLFDLNMMVLFGGGRERTLAEFERLFRAAGLNLVRVSSTASASSVLECVV